MHFAQLPEMRRRQAPSWTALSDDRHPAVSNERFALLVSGAAELLSGLGVGEGSVVAVKLPNRSNWSSRCSRRVASVQP